MPCSMFRMLALVCLLAVAGCSRKSTASGPATISFQVVDHEGSAALQFLDWTLVFEAIPSRSVSLGQTNVLYNGSRPASANSEVSLGALQLRQFWSPQTWMLSVNNLPIKLSENGRRLTFADHQSYVLKDKPRTIIVSRSGVTREVSQ